MPNAWFSTCLTEHVTVTRNKLNGNISRFYECCGRGRDKSLQETDYTERSFSQLPGVKFPSCRPTLCSWYSFIEWARAPSTRIIRLYSV
jgi:hypothetical protein